MCSRSAGVQRQYVAGEVPPRRYDCPFHAGQVLPCQQCIDWVNLPVD